MQNNNQSSKGAMWIFLVMFAVIFVYGVFLLYGPTDNTKPVLLPMSTITYKKTATSTETNEDETFFKAIENAPEDSYTYLDIKSKPNTIYLLGEREKCKKAGGKFYYIRSYFSALEDSMLCEKTTYEGNKTITEEIFNYTLSND